MDYTLYYKFVPNNGYAIHSGNPKELSHGCVHVTKSLAKKIFQFTDVECPINVTQKGR